jgi:hypothetical protein
VLKSTSRRAGFSTVLWNAIEESVHSERFTRGETALGCGQLMVINGGAINWFKVACAYIILPPSVVIGIVHQYQG